MLRRGKTFENYHEIEKKGIRHKRGTSNLNGDFPDLIRLKRVLVIVTVLGGREREYAAKSSKKKRRQLIGKSVIRKNGKE